MNMTNRIKLQNTITACSVVLLLFIVGVLIKIYLDDSNENWKREYVWVIETWKQESKDDILGYDFVYLNSDDIPELLLYCYDEAWTGFDIYTIVKGKAVRLELYNLNGEKEENTLTSNGRQCQGDSYLYKQGVLLKSGGMMGCYWVKGYMYREGRLEQIFDYSYINTKDWSEDNTPISYEIEYLSSDGKIEKIRKERDVHFESCPELSTLEFEYGVSFSDRKDLLASSLLNYDETLFFLQNDNQQPLNRITSQMYQDIINEYEKEYSQGELRYSLIYVTDDNIPELLIDNPSYWISLYIFHSGKVYSVMDHEPYGCWGRDYSYRERKGVIKSYVYDISNDMQICYEELYRLTDNYELVEAYPYLNVLKYYSEDGEMKYYIGDNEITHDEFNEYLGSGYLGMNGEYSANEMCEMLSYPDMKD